MNHAERSGVRLRLSASRSVRAIRTFLAPTKNEPRGNIRKAARRCAEECVDVKRASTNSSAFF